MEWAYVIAIIALGLLIVYKVRSKLRRKKTVGHQGVREVIFEASDGRIKAKYYM